MADVPCPGIHIYIPLCFYFIGASAVISEVDWINLHSTMLLLYRFNQPNHIHVFINLHSTMLLLYPDTVSLSGVPSTHLHSTMLLLYPHSCQISGYRKPHLHSTMLLLYQKEWDEELDNYDIYIPLCFYFINMENQEINSNNPHLHSTMLLLYRKKRLRDMTWDD